MKPGDHGSFAIFVQSTSVNRKLVAGTSLLYKEGLARLQDSPLITTLLHGLSLLLQIQAYLAAAVLGALLGGALRAGLLLFLDGGHGWGASGCGVGGPQLRRFGLCHASLAAPILHADGGSLVAGGLAVIALAGGVVLSRILWGYVPLPSLLGVLLRIILLLLVAIFALLALMRSGFLNLATDQPVLRVGSLVRRSRS